MNMYGENFAHRKPSRIWQRRKREEQRNPQQKEDAPTENLLDLEVPELSEKSDVTETSINIEENNSNVVTDSIFIENKFSHVPSHQDYEPQDHLRC